MLDLTLEDHQRRVGPEVSALLGSMRGSGRAVYWTPIRSYPEGEALHQLSPDLHRSVVIDVAARWASGRGLGMRRLLGFLPAGDEDRLILGRILGSFASRAIPYTRSDAELLLGLADTILNGGRTYDSFAPIPIATAAAERVVRLEGVGDLAVPIETLVDSLGRVEIEASRASKYRARLVALLGGGSHGLDLNMVTDGDFVGRALEGAPSGRPRCAACAPRAPTSCLVRRALGQVEGAGSGTRRHRRRAVATQRDARRRRSGTPEGGAVPVPLVLPGRQCLSDAQLSGPERPGPSGSDLGSRAVRGRMGPGTTR